MTKKITLTVFTIISLTGLSIFFFKVNTVQDNSIWKTYTSKDFGFSIQYPSQYSIQENNSSNTEWSWVQLLSIFDSNNMSKSEFNVIPVSISLQKQPLIYQGDTYETIEEYVAGGLFLQENSLDPRGKIISINGAQALQHQFLQGDAESAPIDSYYFIKNKLIYQFFFNRNNPYYKEILQSIHFIN